MRTRPVKKKQAHWSKIMDFKPFHEEKKKQNLNRCSEKRSKIAK